MIGLLVSMIKSGWKLLFQTGNAALRLVVIGKSGRMKTARQAAEDCSLRTSSRFVDMSRHHGGFLWHRFIGSRRTSLVRYREQDADNQGADRLCPDHHGFTQREECNGWARRWRLGALGYFMRRTAVWYTCGCPAPTKTFAPEIRRHKVAGLPAAICNFLVAQRRDVLEPPTPGGYAGSAQPHTTRPGP